MHTLFRVILKRIWGLFIIVITEQLSSVSEAKGGNAGQRS